MSKLTENGQSVIKEDKSKAKETKRQNSSVKKKPPSYNNTVPLDLSYNDEIDLYESYEHKEATDSSYTNSMIEEALTDTDENTMVNEDGFKKETQNHLNFERENSNRLRNAQGSFIVSDDAHHEGLAFTERQISNSGLPEIVVEYNANKEAESPLHWQEMQAYENQAFETIDEDATQTEDEKLAQTSVHVDDTGEATINNQERNEEHVHQIGNSEPDIPLYDDENIPTKISENSDIDALPLNEDADETTISDAPFYDDNFVPESITAEKDTVDILPIYDCADDNNESQEMVDNTAISLPLYELAVETNVVEHCDNDSTEEQTEPTDIDELGLYEDYEISKLPPAPPPPIRQDLNDTLCTMDTTQGEILTLKPNNVTLDNVHVQMSIGGAENSLPPEPPKRIGIYQLQNDSNRNILKEPSNRRDRNNVWDNGSALDFYDSAPGTNPVVNDKVFTPNINSEQQKNDTNMVFQNSETKTPKLLDLSLEPERKFRSGSKVDVFDEPVISQSDDYFLDMNDAPSEIFDASPVIGDGKLISVNTVSNELTEANHLPTPPDNSSFWINSGSSNGNIVTETSLRNENDKSITNVTTDAVINADSVPIGNLLDFGTEQIAPNSEQTGSSHQLIQQNGNFDPLSDLVQIDDPGDDNDIYDTPPPNFPPPQLKLN